MLLRLDKRTEMEWMKSDVDKWNGLPDLLIHRYNTILFFTLTTSQLFYRRFFCMIIKMQDFNSWCITVYVRDIWKFVFLYIFNIYSCYIINSGVSKNHANFLIYDYRPLSSQATHFHLFLLLTLCVYVKKCVVIHFNLF